MNPLAFSRFWRKLTCLIAPASLVLATAASAATLTVVGTPHLRSLDPAASPAQRQLVVNRLAAFEPSIVCVEAMPGERVEQFMGDPLEHGELLRHFAHTAVQLGPDQQVRLGLDRRAARAEAATLEHRQAPLESGERLRLIGLQLAAFEPWSALLNWHGLDESGHTSAADTLGAMAVERLQQLAQSNNEIVTLAIPLARRAGHRRLCAVDSFVDEATVQTLAEDLMPLIGDADIRADLEAFAAERGRRWAPDREDGLVELLAWMNSSEWAERDRATQWDIFDSGSHDGATRRLMLWHARNAEIQTWLFRTLAEVDGERPLLLIGGAHRPFIEQALEAHRWIEVVPAHSLLAPE